MMQALEQTTARYWRYDAEDLKTLETCDLVESICMNYGVSAEKRSDLELVIAEAVNNAIDHGVLGLDSALKKDPDGFEQFFSLRASRLLKLQEGFVGVEIDQLDSNTIAITVSDSGSGFDFPKVGRSLQPESMYSAYGRGLLIVSHLCSAMVHLGNGNSIYLEFKLT